MSDMELYRREVDPISGPFSPANAWVDDLIDRGLLVKVTLREKDIARILWNHFHPEGDGLAVYSGVAREIIESIVGEGSDE